MIDEFVIEQECVSQLGIQRCESADLANFQSVIELNAELCVFINIHTVHHSALLNYCFILSLLLYIRNRGEQLSLKSLVAPELYYPQAAQYASYLHCD